MKKELRIGNFVQADDYYPYADIDGVYTDYVGIGVVLYDYDAVSPIKLTKEWLVNFGFEYFEKIVTNGWGDLSYYFLEMPDGAKLEIFTDFSCNHYHGAGVIEYVHQLQNLYFALTGDELKLKA